MTMKWKGKHDGKQSLNAVSQFDLQQMDTNSDEQKSANTNSNLN